MDAICRVGSQYSQVSLPEVHASSRKWEAGLRRCNEDDAARESEAAIVPGFEFRDPTQSHPRVMHHLLL